MNPEELKKKYISFFESQKHTQIPSASLIPENDPTVLFTTAGMQPLIPFLMGEKHPLGNRLTSIQKCIRTGDIDEVGDATHLTFFEMLGNWSLGDYFKQEAISWSYDFLTNPKWLNLDVNRLAVSVFAGDSDAPRDEEAASIWKSLGITEQRIAYLGKKDNWWDPAGQTGPCGPDTEMFYWKPNDIPPPKSFDAEDSNWVEIWNDVFMQFEKTQDGSLKLLKQQNVDTGMGYERVVMTLQGVDSVYDTELFTPILETLADISQKSYSEYQTSFRIIADHIKTATMILGDERSVKPSNVDQGYILRRLIRRAVRHGLLLGITEPFCAKLAKNIIDMYQNQYETLQEKSELIYAELTLEEEKFQKTIEKGMTLIKKQIKNTLIGELRQKDEKLFELYKTKDDDSIINAKQEIGISELLVKPKWLFDMFQSNGMPPELVLEEVEQLGFSLKQKEDTLKEFNQLFKEHQEKSRIGAEQKFKGGLADNSEKTTKLHTATHILNEALRKIIDPTIVQKGSNITEQRLRFDFNFERKLTDTEVKAVEDEVNRVIKLAIPITKKMTTPDDAKAQGAQSEFGAKYPNSVSVYDIGDYSKEICMGPHVQNTKDIGVFKIIKEESSASGIRRIKAIVQ